VLVDRKDRGMVSEKFEVILMRRLERKLMGSVEQWKMGSGRVES